MGLLEKNAIKEQNDRMLNAWGIDDLKKAVLNTKSVAGDWLIIIAIIFLVISLSYNTAYIGIAICMFVWAVICFIKVYMQALVKCLVYIAEKISDK